MSVTPLLVARGVLLGTVIVNAVVMIIYWDAGAERPRWASFMFIPMLLGIVVVGVLYRRQNRRA